MVIWLSAALLGLALAVGVWWGLQHGLRAWLRYRRRVDSEARSTLDAAFLFLDVDALGPLVWCLGGALGVLMILLGGPWWLLPPLAGGLLPVPRLVLAFMRRRRCARFDAQLPDMVQALAGALRAGSGLQPALAAIISQSEAPLSQEFGLLLREQRLGLGFPQALEKLHERMPSEACGLVVSALMLSSRTGGSLADTLDGIAGTLRSRQHWAGRVRALTAQGRMQSYIMAGLPLCLLWVLSHLEPETMGLLWRTSYGWAVLCLVLVLEVTGWIWIRKIMSIEI